LSKSAPPRPFDRSCCNRRNFDLAKTIKLSRSEENASQDSLLIASGPYPDIDRVLNNQREPRKTAYPCHRCGGKDGYSANELAARKWGICRTFVDPSREEQSPTPTRTGNGTSL